MRRSAAMQRNFWFGGVGITIVALGGLMLAGGCPTSSTGDTESTDGTADGGTAATTGCDDNVDGRIEVAATGQRTSYANDDDGDLQSGAAWTDATRFVDNGDGTITDQMSGLMWVRDASCQLNHYRDFDNDGWPNEHVTWQRALEFVAAMNAGTASACAGGYSDWRIPNVVEFESLVNVGAAAPNDWLETVGFRNVLADDYWTSTTDPDTITTFGYTVEFSAGNVSRLGNKATAPAITCVWPVRGTSATLWQTGQTTSYAAGDDGALRAGVTWPDPRFTDNGDGTITDNLTGLIWLQDADCLGVVTWTAALVACDRFNTDPSQFSATNYTANCSDWRLPNRREIFSLADFACYEPALADDHPFVNVSVNATYWTSNTYAGDTERAWWGDMRTGELGHDYKVNARRIMLVRD